MGTLRRLIAAAALCVAIAAAPPVARAENLVATDLAQDASLLAISSTAWCVQGAVLTVAFTLAVSAPAVASGVLPILTGAEIASLAGSGCGFGVVWGATVNGIRWLAGQVTGAPPSRPSGIITTKADTVDAGAGGF